MISQFANAGRVFSPGQVPTHTHKKRRQRPWFKATSEQKVTTKYGLSNFQEANMEVLHHNVPYKATFSGDIS